MTDLSTEPVAAQAPATNPPPTPEPTTPTSNGTKVEHTPGGWPVVPLALTGANATVGMVAAASLAGGPIAAMVAGTGAVVLGTVAARGSRKPNPRKEARRAAARAAGRSAARTAGMLNRSGSTGTGRRHASRAGGGGGRSGAVPRQHRGKHGSASRTTANGMSGTAGTGRKKRNSAGQSASRSLSDPASKGAGRVGQIRALRAERQGAAGSRAQQRAQTTAARRAVADARRNTKSTAGASLSKGRNGGGGLLGGTARKARSARDAAVAKNRAARDAKAGGTVAAQRAALRKAPIRKATKKALHKSAARFRRRRLLAALVALPVGMLGLLTTWFGRKFNIPALMYPGRRLFRRLVGTAAEQRAERDAVIREEQASKEAAADEEAAQDGTENVADQVERPAAKVPTSTAVSEGEHVSGFRFEEAASEMEQAANAYEPDNAMEILTMVEGLPAALTSVANVMKILAERSDSEFPLEKEIADAFNDIFGALMSAVAVAEDMGPLFRQVHEQDISRHEDPRNGPEAEKGWNV